jgi:hypothetical protein
MAYSNVLDPTAITASQRRCEVASILALGLVRLRTTPPPSTDERAETQLDLSAQRSVHTNPASRVRMAIRGVLPAQHKGV